MPYEVCSFSANMALTSSACRQQSAVKGGTLQNKKRYPSGLETDCSPSPKRRGGFAETCDDGFERMIVLLRDDLMI